MWKEEKFKRFFCFLTFFDSFYSLVFLKRKKKKMATTPNFVLALFYLCLDFVVIIVF